MSEKGELGKLSNLVRVASYPWLKRIISCLKRTIKRIQTILDVPENLNQ